MGKRKRKEDGRVRAGEHKKTPEDIDTPPSDQPSTSTKEDGKQQTSSSFVARKKRRNGALCENVNNLAVGQFDDSCPGLSLHNLPSEVLLHIFLFLKAEDMGRVARVCKEFSVLTNDEVLWFSRLKYHFGRDCCVSGGRTKETWGVLELLLERAGSPQAYREGVAGRPQSENAEWRNALVLGAKRGSTENNETDQSKPHGNWKRLYIYLHRSWTRLHQMSDTALLFWICAHGCDALLYRFLRKLVETEKERFCTASKEGLVIGADSQDTRQSQTRRTGRETANHSKRVSANTPVGGKQAATASASTLAEAVNDELEGIRSDFAKEAYSLQISQETKDTLWHWTRASEKIFIQSIIDVVDEDGWSPLMVAVNANHHQVVRQLLALGAHLEFRSDSGSTCLLLAADNGLTAMAETLLLHGAEVDARDVLSSTALLSAAFQGNLEMVRLLLSYNADIEAATSNGITPLLISTHEGHIAVVEHLLKQGANIESRDESYYTPILVAAHKGNVEMLKLLISYGANIEAVNSEGSTALFVAAYRGYVDVVACLIENGANVEVLGQNGYTPLIAACHENHIDVVRYLLNGTTSNTRKLPISNINVRTASFAIRER
ncbi:Ankyrin repeat domain-containing protein, variant 2 [Balamuthia mandrillaris]